MSVFEARRHQVFPVLAPAQVEMAKRFASGAPQTFAPGETVFEIGAREVPAWLVLAGSLVIYRRDGLHPEVRVTSHRVGQFSGEITQLAGRGTLVAGCAGPHGCTAIPFDAPHLRALVIGRPA